MRSISFYSRCWLVARSSSGRNPVSRASPPNGRSCAIMQYLCNKHEITKFYPKMAEQRAMIDSATFYQHARPRDTACQ